MFITYSMLVLINDYIQNAEKLIKNSFLSENDTDRQVWFLLLNNLLVLKLNAHLLNIISICVHSVKTMNDKFNKIYH